MFVRCAKLNVIVIFNFKCFAKNSMQKYFVPAMRMLIAQHITHMPCRKSEMAGGGRGTGDSMKINCKIVKYTASAPQWGLP